MAKPRTENSIADIARFAAQGHAQSPANVRVLLDEIERLRNALRAKTPAPQAIYVVTVMTDLRRKTIVVPGRYAAPDRTREVEHRDSRSWGWYATLAEAEAALKMNYADMHEGIYDIAVIERYEPGILPVAAAQSWWRFEPRIKGYEPAERPADLETVVNFALG